MQLAEVGQVQLKRAFVIPRSDVGLPQLLMRGRDGQVRGEVQSQALKDAAEQQLKNLYGAREIDTQFVVRPFDAPWIMVERGEAGGLRVAGLMSNEAERRSFATQLAGAIGDEIAIDLQIEVREKVDPAPWSSRSTHASCPVVSASSN